MVPFKNTLILIAALFLECIASSAFSQEVCEGGVCRQPLPAMVGEAAQTSARIVTAPVRAVITTTRNRPVRKWVASRPLLRVFGGPFHCRQ